MIGKIHNLRVQGVAAHHLENTISRMNNKTKVFLSFILLTHGDHIGRSTGNSNPVMTSSAGGAKGCSDHRFCASPAYNAQLLTLRQYRANNQNRTANQI